MLEVRFWEVANSDRKEGTRSRIESGGKST